MFSLYRKTDNHCRSANFNNPKSVAPTIYVTFAENALYCLFRQIGTFIFVRNDI